jgi:hypothetical protein
VSSPMTYAELFAAVAQRVGTTFSIHVQTFRHVRGADSAITTEWSISWHPLSACKIVFGDSAESALAALDAALTAPLPSPVADQTGVGELVGAAIGAP